MEYLPDALTKLAWIASIIFAVGLLFGLILFIESILVDRSPKEPKSMKIYIEEHIAGKRCSLYLYDSWQWSIGAVIAFIKKYPEVADAYCGDRITKTWRDNEGGEDSCELGDIITIQFKLTQEQIEQRKVFEEESRVHQLNEQDAESLYKAGTHPNDFPAHLRDTYWFKYAGTHYHQDRARDASINYWRDGGH